MITQPKKATTRRKPAIADNKTSPVYFLLLHIDNVLCFKEPQELKLSDKNGKPAQWTVILGNNGVGKTTLLRCLAGMEIRETEEINLQNNKLIKSYFPLLFDPSESLSLMWNELDLLEESGAHINALVSFPETLKAIHESKKDSPINFQVASIEVIVNTEAGMATEFDEGIPEDSLKGFICYGYGATRRIGQTSLSERISAEHSASLFSDNATLINAEEWLLQTDYAVKSSSGKMRTRLRKQFNQIIEILKKILPDVENVRISLGKDRDLPRAEFLTPFGWVSLSSLGLGYRTTITWMVDLAVRLFKRYPDSEDPLAEPAIVLVDEIDLHMHPKWQRDIMQFLTDRFPNTQFIVTAHSPLVVQAAQDANIVLLRREGDRVVIDNNPEIIENWRVDQVLTSVFEMPSARPAKIEPLLQRRKEILTKPKLTVSDRAELKELEAKIGTLPTAETSEDIKAMDIIRRAAKLLDRPVTEAVE